MWRAWADQQQSDAGVIPANFGYDLGGTGQMTNLTTYQNATVTNGVVSGTASAQTQWNFDPSTGQLFTSQINRDVSEFPGQINRDVSEFPGRKSETSRFLWLGAIIQGHSARANSGPGGPGGVQNAGRWETVNESMSPSARAYQAQITGRSGQTYVVNGVKFDGVSAESLIEAKGPGYAWAVRNRVFRQDYRGAAELLDQAERQIGAARGLPITWHVAEPETAAAIQNLFTANKIVGITVVHTPVVP